MLGEQGGGQEPSPPLPLQPHQLFWGAGCPEPVTHCGTCGERGHLSGTTLQPFSLRVHLRAAGEGPLLAGR